MHVEQVQLARFFVLHLGKHLGTNEAGFGLDAVYRVKSTIVKSESVPLLEPFAIWPGYRCSPGCASGQRGASGHTDLACTACISSKLGLTTCKRFLTGRKHFVNLLTWLIAIRIYLDNTWPIRSSVLWPIGAGLESPGIAEPDSSTVCTRLSCPRTAAARLIFPWFTCRTPNLAVCSGAECAKRS